MSELRWHPYLEQWVITATHRQERTFLPPKEYCPLCPTRPGSMETEVPYPDYEIVVFENRFPSLQRSAPEPAVEATPLTPVMPAQGVCEVVLYTPQHEGEMADLSVEQIAKLVEVWTDRFEELSSYPFVEYVLIFENKGKEIGVTIPHPHGQIYAYPFLPPLIEREILSARKYYEQFGKCLVCAVMEQELQDGRRLITRNEHFVAFVPFFARFPYEVHVVPVRHVGTLPEMSTEEHWSLAEMLSVVTRTLRNLWEMSIPYIMLLHQSPAREVNSPSYHFHVEFYPFNRTRDKLKYLAGSEQAGTFINDTLAEETAASLRESLARLQK
ncbi:MAG: galactose-1-phosphate uridylyltransferase [Firmicutes bacterium]|nr:galactose-1-phosphate uridylyltransferase [Bacillota bacterium]